MSVIWIINQYASTPDTGIGGRHWYLARELARRGHSVHLIAARWHHLLRDPDASLSAPFVEANAGFNFVRLTTNRYSHAHDKRRFLNWLQFTWHVLHLPKWISARPDVVMYSSPSLFGSLAAARLARRFSARFIFEVRDIWPLTLVELGGKSPLNPLIRLMQRIEDHAYSVADGVVSVLPGAATHMAKRGMASEKFSWIPNGFSLADVRNPAPLPEEIQAQLPTGKFIVGYTGTMGLANSLDNLIAAAKLLRDEKDIAFVLVGSGRERTRLEMEASVQGLSNVIFLDSIPKPMIQSILASFDACFIGWNRVPLYRFGIAANKLFDYFCAARPVLHSYSGSYDPVTDYNAGFTVQADDPRALAEAILLLRSLPVEERRRMGQSGRRAAFRHHEYGMLAEKLESVLLGSMTRPPDFPPAGGQVK